ncbi:hypothetical protein FU976_08040 [Campylobacter jejuni]|nr:hypothetical protein [Campylobacter jejuni]
MIQAGDIILVRGNTPVISRAIRWFTNSEYTHVALAVTEDLILEIDINKDLAIRPLTHENYDVYRYKNGLTMSQKTSMAKRAIQIASTNKGYDWLAIVRFAFEKLFLTKKAFQNAKRLVCSEIVDNLYNHIHIDLVPGRIDGDVAPGHFTSSPELIKVYSSKGA